MERKYICKYKADTLADDINGLFERKVEMQTIKYCKKQSIDKLIHEESPIHYE